MRQECVKGFRMTRAGIKVLQSCELDAIKHSKSGASPNSFLPCPSSSGSLLGGSLCRLAEFWHSILRKIHLKPNRILSTAEFPNRFGLGTDGGEEGTVPCAQRASMHARAALFVPAARENGACVHTFSCCLHEWGCARLHAHPPLLWPGNKRLKAW